MGRPRRRSKGVNRSSPGCTGHGLLGVGAVDDGIGEPQGALARDAAPQVLLQDGVIDRRKVAIDVAAQHLAEAVSEALVAGDGPVGPLAQAVGVAVVDEALLEERPDDGAQGVVDHPVGKGRGGDVSGLGVVNRDLDIAARAPGPRLEVSLQSEQLRLQPGHEGRRPGFRPLAADRAPGRGVQGGEAGDPVEQVPMALGHLDPCARRRPAGRSRRVSAPRAHSAADPDNAGPGTGASGSAASRSAG